MKLNSSLHICVTGGAGYIGSHVVMNILENTNHTITIIDNLSTGCMDTINTLNEFANSINKRVRVLIMDLVKKDELIEIFDKLNFDAVFHLAALSQVKESDDEPNKYKINNLQSTSNILECMKKYNVKYLIFSSSASIYESKNDKLSENSLLSPSSIYGETKLECENIIKKFENSIKYINLRFFNAVGCDSKYRIGERHEPESHLFPLVAKAIINKTSFFINGVSFDTRDGTCIRDFIHVEDLAAYHMSALSYMIENNSSKPINCGYSKGYSVKEIVEVMKYISKKDLNIEISSKRDGDLSSLVADTTTLEQTLEQYHSPLYKDNIRTMCKHAYEWELLKMDMK